MSVIRVGVAGCLGAMGRLLVRQAIATSGCTLGAASCRPGGSAVGRDIGIELGLRSLDLPITDDPGELFARSDVVLDFSAPGASETHSALAAQLRKPLLIGTTGLTASQLDAIRAAARSTAVLQGPSMSPGMTILLDLTRRAAAAFGDEFDIEILNMSHRRKVDAPSRAALALAQAAAAARGVALEDVAEHVRNGVIGPRRRGAIGVASLRGGDTSGEHSVFFIGDGERIELAHKATSRVVYAVGALRAALWLRDRSPGLYSMKDVLGLS